MQTTIIVATHKPYWVPDDPMYLPVQMGHAVHPACGYIGDDTGDNISERNANFCELTGLYWAAHNIDSDYIGIVHYRRYFASRRKSRFADKKSRVISHEELCSILLRRTSSCRRSATILLRRTTPSISTPITSRIWR